MGGVLCSETELKVASLNYSGLLLSPFQFLSGGDTNSDDYIEVVKLNNIFIELLKQEKNIKSQQILRSSFSWKVGQIDKKMQRERYSPLYRKDVGIIQNTRLMTKAEFNLRWKSEYQKNVNYINFSSDETSTLQMQQNCMLFDFLCYKTFVEYLYIQQKNGVGDPVLEDRDQGQDLQIRRKRKNMLIKYEQFMLKYFQKSFLNQQYKVKFIKELFQNHDVIFLQEVSDFLLNSLKNQKNINIIEAQEGGCAILIKEGKFHTLYNQKKFLAAMAKLAQNYQRKKSQSGSREMSQRQMIIRREDEQVGPKLLFHPNQFEYCQGEKKTAICFVDNFVLISAQLSSKKDKRQKQVDKILGHILQLHRAYPTMHIIVGCDFNDFLGNQKKAELMKNQGFDYFPNKSEHFTTKKCRSWLQTQIKKAGEIDQKCRDHIISDLKFNSDNSNMQIKSTEKIEYLPTEKHPFDHFVISASLRLPRNS